MQPDRRPRAHRIITGDCAAVLPTLPAESVQVCVTSPPYFDLRDYGAEGQIGLEETPETFIEKLVAVFREVRRILRDDGTLWINMGDSYASGVPGMKPKDMIGIPWMLAFALRADGWFLRSEIIWHKPNPMPESVADRPTKAHEHLFLLSKSARYFYDADAIREPLAPKTLTTFGTEHRTKGGDDLGKVKADNWARSVPTRKPRLTEDGEHAGANKRTVWTVGTQPFKGAHFATFPPRLVEPCILAGSRPGDTVLDPFAGAGTTGLVADRLGRSFVGIEINEEYATMARERIRSDAPLFVREVANA